MEHTGIKVCIFVWKNHYIIQNTLQLHFHLNINVDGLPLHRSSKQEFWPILVNIHELPAIKPLVVGIYSGYGKPKTVQDFLNPLVTELETILREGLVVKKLKLTVHIRCFICDSPARAFIKGKTSLLHIDVGRYTCG